MVTQATDWKAQILDEGYGVVPRVISLPTIRVLSSALEKEAHRRSKAGIRHLMNVPEVAAIANGVEMTWLAKEIVGPDAIPFRATLFDKSSASNWLVAWHQDTALPIRGQQEIEGWGPWSVKEGVVYAHAPKAALERVIALRLHLDNSELDNGPLRVLPGTQTLGVLTDEEIHQLAEKIKPVDCAAPAGGVVMMRPLVIHASSKATSEKPRRVLHIEYAENEEIASGMKLAVV